MSVSTLSSTDSCDISSSCSSNGNKPYVDVMAFGRLLNTLKIHYEKKKNPLTRRDLMLIHFIVSNIPIHEKYFDNRCIKEKRIKLYKGIVKKIKQLWANDRDEFFKIKEILNKKHLKPIPLDANYFDTNLTKHHNSKIFLLFFFFDLFFCV